MMPQAQTRTVPDAAKLRDLHGLTRKEIDLICWNMVTRTRQICEYICRARANNDDDSVEDAMLHELSFFAPLLDKIAKSYRPARAYIKTCERICREYERKADKIRPRS